MFSVEGGNDNLRPASGTDSPPSVTNFTASTRNEDCSSDQQGHSKIGGRRQVQGRPFLPPEGDNYRHPAPQGKEGGYDYTIGKANSEVHKEIKAVTPDVMSMFLRYDWKGNIRELENVVYRGVLMARGNVILKEHVPELNLSPTPAKSGSVDFIRSLDDMEREAIEKTLRFTNWNKSKACELLKIPRPRLDRKIKKYGLKRQA